MSKKVKQSKVKKMSRRNKIIITIIILLVLIAIAFSGFYMFSGYSKNSTTNKSNGITATKKTSVDTTTLSTEAASVVAKSGYAAGQEYLDKALESATVSSEKAIIYTEKISLANLSSQHSEEAKKNSLDYAYEAEKLNSTAQTAMTIASIEESLENKITAIKYYKIYLERSSTDNDKTNYKGDIQYYSTYIKQLESEIK